MDRITEVINNAGIKNGEVITPREIIKKLGNEFTVQFVIGESYEEFIGETYFGAWQYFFEPFDEDADYTADTLPKELMDKEFSVFSVTNDYEDTVITVEIEEPW